MRARLAAYVSKEDEHGMEVDTATSGRQGSSKQLLPESEVYCYLPVLLFLKDQKQYKLAKSYFADNLTIFFSSCYVVIRALTDDIQLILESLGDSSIVVVQDNKIRKRGEWMKWVRFPAHGSFEPGSPSSRVANRNKRSLASSFQNITLEGASNHVDAPEMEDSHPMGSHSKILASGRDR